MTRPIAPNTAEAISRAATIRISRIAKLARPAVQQLHDCQPGYPTGGDGGRSGGGHSDPTANLALSDDPTRAVLEEVTRLFTDLERVTDRLCVLVPNWANANEKWQDSLRTEAASKLNDEHNWCAAHQRAGFMEPARHAGGVLCESCQGLSRDIGGDPPPWLLELKERRRLNTMDIAKAKREVKTRGKRRKKR